MKVHVPRNYGYIRASTDKQELSPEAQRANTERLARQQGEVIDTWVEDPATTAKIRFDQRDGGGELCRLVKRGDKVWISKVDRAFRSLTDCSLILDRWEKAGVGIRLVDIGGQFDISTPQGKAFVQMLAIFAELERKMISARTREALAVLKAQGKCNARFPGYGFSWRKVWNPTLGKHVRHKVANPAERAVMAEIAGWRIAGHDFEAIYHHLRKLGVKTPDGKEWSLDRVKRAYQAELKLQQDENPRGIA